MLRYAGLLEEAARECDAAHAADPQNLQFRSCELVFAYLGKYDRAREYLRADAGSQWTRAREAELLLREGKREAAAALMPAGGWRSALLTAGGPKAETDRLAAEQETYATASPDSESQYMSGGFLAFMGYPEIGERLLKRAVEGNYLAVPAMDTDPFYASVRQRPGFAAIRAEAVRRQNEFLKKRTSG